MYSSRIQRIIAATAALFMFSACELLSGDLVPDLNDLVGIQIGTVQPNPAAPGDVVTILGYGFGEPYDAASNSIFEGYGLRISDQVLDFNTGSQSDVKSWSNEEIKFVVPNLKPGTYTITIQVDFEEEYYREFNIAEAGSTTKQIAGWVLHDATPTATLFYAIATGKAENPFSWDLTTRQFSPDPSTAEDPYAILFDFPAPSGQGGLELKDVDTDILTGTSFISFSEYPVSGHTANHGIYMFDTNFVTPVTEKILRAGANPFRFADRGPPTLLAQDGTVSMLDSENLSVAGVFTLASLIDPAFEATNLSWLTDPRLGDEEENGRALVLFGTHTGFETAQIHLIYSDTNGLNLDSYSLDGYSSASDVLIVPSDSQYVYVVAKNTDGQQEIIKHAVRNATESTEFATPASHTISSNIVVPAKVEVRDGDYSTSKLFLTYSEETSDGSQTAGILSLRTEDAFRGLDLSLDAFFGVTVPVAALPVSSTSQQTAVADGTAEDPLAAYDFDERTSFEVYEVGEGSWVDATVNTPVHVLFGSSATISIDQRESFTWGLGVEITSSTTTLQVDSENSLICPMWFVDCGGGPGQAPGYLPSNPFIAGRTVYDIDSAANHVFTVSAAEAGEHTLFFTFADDYEVAYYSTVVTFVAPPAEKEEPTIEIPEFVDRRVIPEQVTVAMRILDGDRNTVAQDPRDLYAIPGTPLVLVTDHATDSVAVINAAPEFPLYLHNFPSYASGPTRLSCGFNGSESLGDYR